MILKRAMRDESRQSSQSFGRADLPQQQTNDPIDLFLTECGLAITWLPATSIPNHRSRSIKEELGMYTGAAEGADSFEQFWNEFQFNLPRLSSLVRSYNVRPATSVASESLFSMAGYVQRKQRASLAPETLRYSLILRDQKILATLTWFACGTFYQVLHRYLNCFLLNLSWRLSMQSSILEFSLKF